MDTRTGALHVANGTGSFPVNLARPGMNMGAGNTAVSRLNTAREPEYFQIFDATKVCYCWNS